MGFFMRKVELQLLTTELQRHFSVSYLEDFARKTRFTQRKRKWKVQDFISLCVFWFRCKVF